MPFNFEKFIESNRETITKAYKNIFSEESPLPLYIQTLKSLETTEQFHNKTKQAVQQALEELENIYTPEGYHTSYIAHIKAFELSQPELDRQLFAAQNLKGKESKPYKDDIDCRTEEAYLVALQKLYEIHLIYMHILEKIGENIERDNSAPQLLAQEAQQIRATITSSSGMIINLQYALIERKEPASKSTALESPDIDQPLPRPENIDGKVNWQIAGAVNLETRPSPIRHTPTGYQIIATGQLIASSLRTVPQPDEVKLEAASLELPSSRTGEAVLTPNNKNLIVGGDLRVKISVDSVLEALGISNNSAAQNIAPSSLPPAPSAVVPPPPPGKLPPPPPAHKPLGFKVRTRDQMASVPITTICFEFLSSSASGILYIWKENSQFYAQSGTKKVSLTLNEALEQTFNQLWEDKAKLTTEADLFKQILECYQTGTPCNEKPPAADGQAALNEQLRQTLNARKGPGVYVSPRKKAQQKSEEQAEPVIFSLKKNRSRPVEQADQADPQSSVPWGKGLRKTSKALQPGSNVGPTAQAPQVTLRKAGSAQQPTDSQPSAPQWGPGLLRKTSGSARLTMQVDTGEQKSQSYLVANSQFAQKGDEKKGGDNTQPLESTPAASKLSAP